MPGRTGERPANLRAAQSSRTIGSSQEGVVRWDATPELVSQDRERVRLGRKASSGPGYEYRHILRSAQWGLAAMPAPISFGPPKSADFGGCRPSSRAAAAP